MQRPRGERAYGEERHESSVWPEEHGTGGEGWREMKLKRRTGVFLCRGPWSPGRCYPTGTGEPPKSFQQKSDMIMFLSEK